jgi:hypothetical protein
MQKNNNNKRYINELHCLFFLANNTHYAADNTSSRISRYYAI